MSRVWDWIRYLWSWVSCPINGGFSDNGTDGADIVKSLCTLFILQTIALFGAVQDFSPTDVLVSNGGSVAIASEAKVDTRKAYTDRLILSVAIYGLASFAIVYWLLMLAIIREHHDLEGPRIMAFYGSQDKYFYDKPTVYLARSFFFLFLIASVVSIYLSSHRSLPGQVRQVSAPKVEPYEYRSDGEEGIVVVVPLVITKVDFDPTNGTPSHYVDLSAEINPVLLSAGWRIHSVKERDDDPNRPDRIKSGTRHLAKMDFRPFTLTNHNGIYIGEEFNVVVYLKPIEQVVGDKEPLCQKQILEGFESGLYSLRIQPHRPQGSDLPAVDQTDREKEA